MEDNSQLYSLFSHHINHNTEKIHQLDFVNTLHYTNDSIDEIIKLYEADNLKKIVSYAYEKYNKADYIRVALIKTTLSKFFFFILIDPVELFKDIYVKRCKEIDEEMYLLLLYTKGKNSN